jgi:hypothetical protein
MARCCSQRTESGGETRPFVITLSRDERAALEARTRKYVSPYRDVIRAKIVLLASTGLGNDLIASRLNLARQIVSKWRKRLFDERLADLNEDPRGGRRARFRPSSSLRSSASAAKRRSHGASRSHDGSCGSCSASS